MHTILIFIYTVSVQGITCSLDSLADDRLQRTKNKHEHDKVYHNSGNLMFQNNACNVPSFRSASLVVCDSKEDFLLVHYILLYI